MSDTSKPNPAWIDCKEGEECGAGFYLEKGKVKWYKLVIRGGKQVAEQWDGPKEAK
jgi:hypothetical protein